MIKTTTAVSTDPFSDWSIHLEDMTSKTTRKYDLILLGATGYTGRLCAEHITTSLPTNLKWAIAGRSQDRLLKLLIDLKNINPDRQQPDIEVASLVPSDLNRLAKCATLIINTVGPYYLYSSPVVAACASNGTHYLDVTGESPWVKEMITQNHDLAKANHAIIIPQIGMESAPSDLLVWCLASLLRRTGSAGLKEVVGSLHELQSRPSGGTLATVLGIFDSYSVKEISASTNWTHSTIGAPKGQASPLSLSSTLLGVREVAGLGTLTTSINAGPNVATVQRSWSLLDNGHFYGPDFQYREYVAVRSKIVGIALHFGTLLGALLITLAPVRWLLKQLVYQPGQGAAKEVNERDFYEQRAVAEGEDGRKAFARYRYEGGIYYMTGLLLAEAAMVILKDTELTQKLDGGILTPSCLGQGLVDRLRGAHVTIECELRT